MQGIYKIANKVNGKYYIGSTNDFDRRWLKEHLPVLRGGVHSLAHLQNAWNKYGEDNFEFLITEEVKGDRKTLMCREQDYLDEGFSKGVLYNQATRAGGGDSSGEASRMWGRHHSIETKQKIGKSNGGESGWWFGKKHTEETKAKMSVAQSGKNNPQWGKSPSKETRCKQSEAHKGNDANAKPYPAFYNDITKEFIPAGRNLYKMCKEKALAYQNIRNLKFGKLRSAKDGWRLAIPEEIDKLGECNA